MPAVRLCQGGLVSGFYLVCWASSDAGTKRLVRKMVEWFGQRENKASEASDSCLTDVHGLESVEGEKQEDISRRLHGCAGCVAFDQAGT